MTFVLLSMILCIGFSVSFVFVILQVAILFVQATVLKSLSQQNKMFGVEILNRNILSFEK